MGFTGKFVVLATASLFVNLTGQETGSSYAKLDAMLRKIPEKPERCYGTDELLDAKCCIVPPFFAREIARECGAIFTVSYSYDKHNVTSYFRKGLNCDAWKCILNKYNLLVNDYVNEEKFFNHLNRWVKLNTEFKDAIGKAKSICKIDFGPNPIHICKYINYHFCYRNYLNVDCPVIVETQLCKKQKDFFDECREYFI